MPTITISLATDNAAFEDQQGPQEVARILKEIAERLVTFGTLEEARFGSAWQLMDVNGNTVGAMWFSAV